jgi:hypothetical protein
MKRHITTSITEWVTENFDNKVRYSITTYNVVFHTETSSDNIYTGMSKEDALSEYRNFDDIPSNMINSIGLSLDIKSFISYYEFVYELDEYETIEDYPIEDYHTDQNYYVFIEDGDFEEIDHKAIEPKNKKSDHLLNNIQSYFQEKYGNYKYNRIEVEDSTGEKIGSIQLRISDHTENINNNDRFGISDYFISVVIADFDVTLGRFGMTNSFERRRSEYVLSFGSDSDLEQVIGEINELIEECEQSIL